MDRTGLEFRLCENKSSSHCHLDIHGSGDSPLRLAVYSRPSIHDAAGIVHSERHGERIYSLNCVGRSHMTIVKSVVEMHILPIKGTAQVSTT